MPGAVYSLELVCRMQYFSAILLDDDWYDDGDDGDDGDGPEKLNVRLHESEMKLKYIYFI